jgi:hypothetical protein
VSSAGGFTDVAYREADGPVKMVSRSKSIPVRCAYILMPTSDLLDSESGELIPAYRPERSPTCTPSSDLGAPSTSSACQRSISLVAMAVGPQVPPARPWSDAASPCDQDDTPGEFWEARLRSPSASEGLQMEDAEIRGGVRDGDAAGERPGVVMAALQRFGFVSNQGSAPAEAQGSNQGSGEGVEESQGIVASAVSALELMEAGRLSDPRMDHGEKDSPSGHA